MGTVDYDVLIQVPDKFACLVVQQKRQLYLLHRLTTQSSKSGHQIGRWKNATGGY